MPADTQYALTERLDRQILPAQAGTFGIVNNDVHGHQIVVTISTLLGGPAGDVIYLRKLGESLTIDRSTLRSVTIEALNADGDPDYPATILLVDTDLPVSVTSIGSAIAGAAGYDPLIVAGQFYNGQIAVQAGAVSDTSDTAPSVGDGVYLVPWPSPNLDDGPDVPIQSEIVVITVAGLDVGATLTTKVQILSDLGSAWVDYIAPTALSADGTRILVIGPGVAASAVLDASVEVAPVPLPRATQIRIEHTLAGMVGPNADITTTFYGRTL